MQAMRRAIALLNSCHYDRRMNKQQVIDFFGGVSATAAALGISQPSVSNWTSRLPELRQLQIERLTRGALIASPECDIFRVPERAQA